MQLKKQKNADIIGNPLLKRTKFEEFKRTAVHKLSNPRFLGMSVLKLGMYILLIGISFIFIFPFIFMAITSLKTNSDLLDPTVGWIPRSIKFKNYQMAFTFMKYKTYFFNSMFITITATIGHLLSCTLIGYGLARYKFRGKNFLFLLVILSIIIPIQTIIIPNYIQFANMGWLDSQLPVLVPTFFGLGLKGGLFVFISRQFLLSLPKEMEEAAKIDGCNFISIFFKIVIPIARPLLLVMLVLSIVWHWNDYYEPVIYFKPSQLPLPSTLKSIIEYSKMTPEELMLKGGSLMLDEEDRINSATVMAGCALTITPLMIMFILIQNKFVQSVERTGLVE